MWGIIGAALRIASYLENETNPDTDLFSSPGNYLPWFAILGAIAIVVLLVVIIAIYCSYHKKNKTGAYFLTKFKVGASQNGQVAHANGYP